MTRKINFEIISTYRFQIVFEEFISDWEVCVRMKPDNSFKL